MNKTKLKNYTPFYTRRLELKKSYKLRKFFFTNLVLSIANICSLFFLLFSNFLLLETKILYFFSFILLWENNFIHF